MRVSIVTATFNRRSKLEANFAGVRRQSFSGIEHIIVDNNSTDGTEELVNDYRAAAAYPVLYIREADSSMYQAMNKGIKAASGEWIHILNSDDRYFRDDSLESVFSMVDIDEYDLLAFPVQIWNSLTGESFIFTPEYVEKNKHYRFPHPGILTKRSFHLKYGFYDERYKTVSDALFGIEHYPKAKYLISTGTPLVTMSTGGASTSFSYRVLKEKLIMLLFHHKFPAAVKCRYLASYLKEFIRHVIRAN